MDNTVLSSYRQIIRKMVPASLCTGLDSGVPGDDCWSPGVASGCVCVNGEAGCLDRAS